MQIKIINNDTFLMNGCMAITSNNVWFSMDVIKQNKYSAVLNRRGVGGKFHFFGNCRRGEPLIRTPLIAFSKILDGDTHY